MLDPPTLLGGAVEMDLHSSAFNDEVNTNFSASRRQNPQDGIAPYPKLK